MVLIGRSVLLLRPVPRGNGLSSCGNTFQLIKQDSRLLCIRFPRPLTILCRAKRAGSSILRMSATSSISSGMDMTAQHDGGPHQPYQLGYKMEGTKREGVFDLHTSQEVQRIRHNARPP